MKWDKKLDEDINKHLFILAEKFRHNNHYYDLDFEERVMINAIGKIFDTILAWLLTYKHIKEEKRLEIRRKAIRLLHKLDEIR